MRKRIRELVIVGLFTGFECEVFYHRDLALEQMRDCSQAGLTLPFIECGDGAAKESGQQCEKVINRRMGGDNNAGTGLRKKYECGERITQFHLILSIDTNENLLSP